MRSKKVTVPVPWPLVEPLEEFAKLTGYKGLPELFLWTGVYALIVAKPHPVTVPIAQASPGVQDIFIDDIVKLHQEGKLHRGSYLEHVLEDLLKRLGVDLLPGVLQAVVADAVRNRPKKTG